MTYVGVVQDGAQYPVEQHKANHDMDFCPPRGHERRASVGNLGPVKCEETHAEAGIDTKELIEDDIIWRILV